MSGWSPPPIPRAWLAAGALVYLALLAYGLLVVQQVLLFAVLPAAFVVVVYVLWRFLVALEAIADGTHRIADELEGSED